MPELYSPSEEDAQDQTSQEHSDDASDDSSSEEDTIDVEALKKELAAKEEENKKLQTKLRDKGRKLKEASTSSESPEYVTKEELWERDNRDAIALVGKRLDQIISEGIEGEPVTRKVALKIALAELRADDGNKVALSRQYDSFIPSSQRREASETVTLTPEDKRVGLTLARKKELQAKYG